MPVRIGILGVLLLAVGCATTEWVNPGQPKANFNIDYNACEQAAYNDPKNQSGSKLYVQRAIDQCIARKGWELREKR
jgi:hypothetical protein